VYSFKCTQPLKVKNRPLSDIRFECATWCWKDLDEGYNFGSDLVAIGLCNRELWPFKVPRVKPGQFRDSISGVPKNLCHLDVASTASCREYYMGEGGGFPPSLGRGESCVSKCPWFVPTPKGVSNAKLTSCSWFLDADSHKLI
jgi:hypothetical protein